jgi:hypothetical protein
VSPRQAPSGGPLSVDHLRALSEARKRSKKIRRAVAVAMFSGWSMAVFAALSLMFAAFDGLVSVVAGGALGAIAFNELRGAGRLKRFDASGARVLGFNQIGLGALICGYSAWSLVSAMRNPAVNAALASMGGTGDPEMDEMVRQMSEMLTWGLYGTMFVVGVVVPGLTSLYYFTRGRHVREFTAATPGWVLEALRAAG